MKRFLFLILLCSPLLFTSCEDKYYVTEEYYDGAAVRTEYLTVQPSHWQGIGTYGQPGYFLEAAYNVNYITNDVIDKGAVLVYAIYDDGDIQLPYVLTRDVGYTIIEMLGYQLYPGGIAFTLDNSDFQAEAYSGPLKFKIVVVR